MPIYKHKTTFASLVAEFGYSRISAAMVFIFRICIERVYELGVELPHGFDETETFARLLTEPNSYDATRDIQNFDTRAYDQFVPSVFRPNHLFWRQFQRVISSLEASNYYLNAASGTADINSFLFDNYETLSMMFNLFQGIARDRPEGFEMAGNLLFDHLTGKIS